MTDRRSVSGTVTTEADGSSRVAYDLMARIATGESDMKRDREYYLRLFAQCRIVVNDPHQLESALELTKR